MAESRRVSDPSTARKPRPRPGSDLSDEFLATLTLYKTLACRFQSNRPFLPRTLWRQDAPFRKNLPTVLYQSGHNRIQWQYAVKRMRCLWCRDKFFRFANMKELLHHLRTCHGRFQYHSGGTLTTNVTGKSRTVEVIHMKLLDGDEGRRVTAVDCLEEPTEEAVYISPDRNMTNSAVSSPDDFVAPASNSRAKRSADAIASSSNEPPAKRQRPVRACTSAKVHANGLEGDVTGRSIRRRSEAWGSNGKERENRGRETRVRGNGKVAKAEGKLVKKGKAVKSKLASVKLAYESVAQAVKEKRLFHSVLQTPVRLEEVEAGEDSDDEDALDYEREWRLALANTEVDDFSDTLAVEKLFFNLWNQFLTTDFHAYSDRMVAPACMKFVKSKFGSLLISKWIFQDVARAAKCGDWEALPEYRRIIHKLNMELTFMRHLIEFRRIGLLGASAVYETMMVLKDRDPEAKSKEEKEAKFYYLDELKRKAAERETNKHKKPDAGRPTV